MKGSLSGYHALALALLDHRPPLEVVRRRQERLIKNLIRHAYDRVSYYRSLMDRHGLHPEQIRCLSDLEHFPTSSRFDMQNAPVEELVATGCKPERLISHRTSGTTGAPLTILRTRAEEILLSGFRLRALRELGLKPTERVVRLAFVRQGKSDGRLSLLEAFQRIGLLRHTIVHALLEPEEQIKSIRKLKPVVLGGYAGVLARLADSVPTEDLRKLHLRFLATGAEVLTPLMRERLQNAFQVPVCDFYGSFEFNLLGWECPTTGAYHCSDQSLVVEVLKDGKPALPGESGEVVVTSLYSRAMPFIRFRLGDLAVKGEAPCACGRPCSTLSKLQGRMVDWLTLPSGRLFHPYHIASRLVLGPNPWIRRYQIVQEKIDRIAVRVLPFRPPLPEEISAVEAGVSEAIGEEVRIRIELVEDLPLEANGKFRVCHSLIRSDYSSPANMADGHRPSGSIRRAWPET